MRRRRFLHGSSVLAATILTGCSEDEDGTPTETGTQPPTDSPEETDETPDEEDTPEEEDDETDVSDDSDYPTDARWDLVPGRNDNLRNELGQFVDSVGSVRQDHPAFDYSTDEESDDVTVDFEALRMIRDSNFDIFVNENPNTPLEQMAEAFVDEDLYESSKNNLFRSHTQYFTKPVN